MVAMQVREDEIAHWLIGDRANQRNVGACARGEIRRVHDQHTVVADDHAGVAVEPVFSGTIVNDGVHAIGDAFHARAGVVTLCRGGFRRRETQYEREDGRR
jgi:hypothetical protein